MTSVVRTGTTIAAIATPQGRGGVGIIRLSGPQARTIAETLAQHAIKQPRYAQFARWYAAPNQTEQQLFEKTCAPSEKTHSPTIDEGLMLYFDAPHSFTGEEVVELQGHGGIMVQQALLTRLYELGAIAAEAGEFSARAFENGKLDLVQAEAIADLIDASSQAAARSAVRSLQGDFSAYIQQVLEKLIHVRLYVEAAIDFSEEDIDFLADGHILTLLDDVRSAVETVQKTARQGQLLREGIQIVIAGRPNAGKSSLLNALAGVERAIVTNIAGTTRDVLHETLILKGLPITLTDTAGLRSTEDVVEREGIRRARLAIAQADLLLLVYDLNQTEHPLILAQEFFAEHMQPNRLLLVGNKADLTPVQAAAFPNTTHPGLTLPKTPEQAYTQVVISAKTGQGLTELIDTITERVGYQPTEQTFIARTRHLEALRQCQRCLNEAREQLTDYAAGELMAESLRQAQCYLSSITGEFTADDLLGEIFGSFCIGK